MIKERPIVMSAPMVRAILEERKTQTRHTCRLDEFCATVPKGFAIDYFVEELPGEWLAISDKEDGEFPSPFKTWIKCPYGNLGDRLWVKEPYKRWCIDGTDTVEDGWWDYQREQWSCVDPIDSYKSLICKINGPKTWEKRAAYRIERHCGNCGRCNHEADMWGEVNSFCTLPTRACLCVTDAPDDFCCNYWEPRKEENEK